jgi:hypothetical protein
MRLMALSILNVAFEVGGRTIGRFETLRNLAADELCKFLFQVTTIKFLFKVLLIKSNILIFFLSLHEPIM